ncbi:MAG TPA: hypothetical protein VFE51_09725 [Verrucomicrobiae bacterium]|nr:hypothetical protein [Verrucomicrobiae bacterium]
MSNSEDQLANAYAEWRRLAEAEGKGIRTGNWCLVSECHHAISLLQARINRLTGLSHPAHRQGSRGTVLELMELQRKNLLSLQHRRERLSAHIEHVTLAGRNLRSIQRSYTAPVPAAWSSYS